MPPETPKPRQEISKYYEYQNLLNTLRSIIEESHADEIDLLTRFENLTCLGCGAYEDISILGTREVFEKDDLLTEHEGFIIIDAREKEIVRNQTRHNLVVYTYICPVCGFYQTAIYREDAETESAP